MKRFVCPIFKYKTAKVAPNTSTKSEDFDVDVDIDMITIHGAMSLNIHKTIIIANLKSFLSSNISFPIHDQLNRMYNLEIREGIYAFFTFNIDTSNNQISTNFLLIKNPSRDTFERMKMFCAESIINVNKHYTSFNKNNLNVRNLEMFIEKTKRCESVSFR